MTDFDMLPSRLVMGASHQDPHRKAALDLLIGHGFWLRHPGFTEACIMYDQNSSAAYIRWDAAREFRAANPQLSSSQLAILDLAVALGSDQYRLSRADDAEAEMIVRAFVQALGVEVPGGR